MALAVGLAQADTLYKWTDAQGRVQYSDRLPKDFKGDVAKIEIDPALNPVAAPKAPADAARAAPPADDFLTKRRANRARLEANLQQARENLAAARKALEESPEPLPDERQVIQRQVAGNGNAGYVGSGPGNSDATQSIPAGGGMHGMTGRANCRAAQGADGKSVTICPSFVPNGKYFERIEQLEENVRKAELELSIAEREYRQGAD